MGHKNENITSSSLWHDVKILQQTDESWVENQEQTQVQHQTCLEDEYQNNTSLDTLVGYILQLPPKLFLNQTIEY